MGFSRGFVGIRLDELFPGFAWHNLTDQLTLKVMRAGKPAVRQCGLTSIFRGYATSMFVLGTVRPACYNFSQGLPWQRLGSG